MSDPSNRGKTAEAAVRKLLKDLEGAHMAFTFNRCLDAHAAGGKFPAQAGDFQAFLAGHYNTGRVWVPGSATDPGTHLPCGRNFIVEVKEVKHDFRLPHKNYSTDKVARVQKRVLAGTEAIVVVLHTTTKTWRAVPFALFQTRTGGSWDLRQFEPVDMPTALREFFGIA